MRLYCLCVGDLGTNLCTWNSESKTVVAEGLQLNLLNNLRRKNKYCRQFLVQKIVTCRTRVWDLRLFCVNPDSTFHYDDPGSVHFKLNLKKALISQVRGILLLAYKKILSHEAYEADWIRICNPAF